MPPGAPGEIRATEQSRLAGLGPRAHVKVELAGHLPAPRVFTQPAADVLVLLAELEDPPGEVIDTPLEAVATALAMTAPLAAHLVGEFGAPAPGSPAPLPLADVDDRGGGRLPLRFRRPAPTLSPLPPARVERLVVRPLRRGLEPRRGDEPAVDEFRPAAAPAGGEVVALLQLVERLVDLVPLGAEHAGDDGDMR